MPTDLYTKEDQINIVENEGLGYAVQSYVDPDLIEDMYLRAIWRQAKELLDDIEEELGAS